MLGAIGGSLELMERRLAKGDFGIERYLQTARQAVLRAATLTHRLLAFARKQPLAPTVFNPNQLITEMSDLLRSTLDETIAIETVLGAGLWLVEADSNQLESTILNIAINARDAMAEGGKLMIETSNAALDQAYCDQNDEVEPGQYIMVAISDTGSGMSADIAQRAFDPFFTTKPAGTGTGLGLSQVYGFIKQSRGHVKIYSELDAGTTVRIYLPRSLSQPGVTTTTIAQPQLAGLAGEVVLVVEDDDAMRHHTAEALRELGYSVLESASAAQALELLAGAPDVTVLLTDVVMPSMDGKRLADEARRRRPELKVLFMTGYTPNAVVHGGILDPAVQFLSKPFTLEELARKLRLVMAKAG
jgi:CheY-like chemotaxis protein